VLAGLFELVGPHLTEQQRRLLAGAGARALGRCGGARMARISGGTRCSAPTRPWRAPSIPTGRAVSLGERAGPLPSGRRPAGGERGCQEEGAGRPVRQPRRRVAAGRGARAGRPGRLPGGDPGCWSAPMLVGPTAIGSGRGRRSWPGLRPRRVLWSRCATSRPAPPRGTRLSAGCSATLDQLAGPAADLPPGHRGADRATTTRSGRKVLGRPGQRRLPAGRQGLRPGVGGGATQAARLAWGVELHRAAHRCISPHGVSRRGGGPRRQVAITGLASLRGPEGGAPRSGSHRGACKSRYGTLRWCTERGRPRWRP
jgi:hypothetical protein